MEGMEFLSITQQFLVVTKYFKMYFKNRLKPYGLNTAEAMVLLVLMDGADKTHADILSAIHTGRNGLPDQAQVDRCQGMTQDEVITDLHYDKGVMTRTMKALEGMGYVRRSVNPKDSRSYLFNVTEKARDLQPEFMEILSTWNDLLLEGVTHQAESRAALDRITENAKKYFEETHTL